MSRRVGVRPCHCPARSARPGATRRAACVRGCRAVRVRLRNSDIDVKGPRAGDTRERRLKLTRGAPHSNDANSSDEHHTCARNQIDSYGRNGPARTCTPPAPRAPPHTEAQDSHTYKHTRTLRGAATNSARSAEHARCTTCAAASSQRSGPNRALIAPQCVLTFGSRYRRARGGCTCPISCRSGSGWSRSA